MEVGRRGRGGLRVSECCVGDGDGDGDGDGALSLSHHNLPHHSPLMQLYFLQRIGPFE